MTKVSTPPEVEIRARELLAAEFEADGRKWTAHEIRSGRNTPTFKRAIRAIVSALTPQDDVVEKGWQPIETAPQTATDVIMLGKDRFGNVSSYVVHWARGGGEEQPPFGPAWFYKCGQYGYAELVGVELLAWMPLPEPPARACLEALGVGDAR